MTLSAAQLATVQVCSITGNTGSLTSHVAPSNARLAASLYGSPFVTTDVDITPARERPNLERLAAALEELDARIRAEGELDRLPFDRSAQMLSNVSILNLTTRHGDLDLTFVPAGTRGYDDLRRQALEIEVRETRAVVAALADVIRSKEAAGRDKDRLVLPTLRRLLERLESGP
jgi:hypothetical protein